MEYLSPTILLRAVLVLDRAAFQQPVIRDQIKLACPVTTGLHSSFWQNGSTTSGTEKDALDIRPAKRRGGVFLRIVAGSEIPPKY
jgi:hypothetical protein